MEAPLAFGSLIFPEKQDVLLGTILLYGLYALSY
jgi:hypothetical protein